jgi:hypothetical protein
MKPVIESIEWLTSKQRADIFECNCKRVYSRAFRKDGGEPMAMTRETELLTRVDNGAPMGEMIRQHY